MKLLAVNAADAAAVSEFQTSNVLLRNEDFDNAAWGKSGASVTANPTPPVGTPSWINSTDKLVEDTSTGNHYCDQVTASQPAGTYTASIYAAPGERTQMHLWVYDAATPANYVRLGINLSTGALATTTGGSGLAIVRTWAGGDQGGGFRRYSITFTISSALTIRYRALLRDGSGTTSYTGDGASGVYLFRAQLEPMPVQTALIYTTSAAANNNRFVSTLPASNVQREGRSLVARSDGATRGNVGWRVEFGATRDVSCVVLYRHNLSASAKLRVVLFSAANLGGSVLYDSGDEDAGVSDTWGSYSWVTDTLAPKFSVLWLPATYAAVSALVLVRDAASPDGYIQAKRLLMGAVVSPTRQLTTGMSLSWVDESTQQRTASGSLRTDPKARYRRLSGDLDALPESERATLLEAAGYAGLSREIFISVFPGVGGTQERDHALLGKITRMPQLTQAKSMYARSTLEISEA